MESVGSTVDVGGKTVLKSCHATSWPEALSWSSGPLPLSLDFYGDEVAHGDVRGHRLNGQAESFRPRR